MVSVLCGAGGGLTVQLPTTTTNEVRRTPRAIQSRTRAVGTPIRVSTALRSTDSRTVRLMRPSNLRSRQSKRYLLAQLTQHVGSHLAIRTGMETLANIATFDSKRLAGYKHRF